MDRSVARLRDKAVRLLQRYESASEDEGTSILRDVAGVFVDLRAHFYDDSGAPDWRGKTYPYRQIIGEVYGLAGVSRDELSTVQAAVRYHVGNVLRERLSPDDLEAIGLRSSSPRERSVEKRERQSALLNALRPGSSLLENLDVLRALTAAHALLGRVPSGAFVALEDPAQKKAAKSLLDDLQDDVERLQKDSRRRR